MYVGILQNGWSGNPKLPLKKFDTEKKVLN